jgi:hypothetical protein
MFVEVIDKEKKYARERGLVSKLLTPTIPTTHLMSGFPFIICSGFSFSLEEPSLDGMTISLRIFSLLPPPAQGKSPP